MKFSAVSVLVALSSTASVSAFGVPQRQVSFTRATTLEASAYDFSIGEPEPKKSKKKVKAAPAPEPEPVPEPTPAPAAPAAKSKPTRKSKAVVVEEPPKPVEEPVKEEPKKKSAKKSAKKVVEEPKPVVVEAPKPVAAPVKKVKTAPVATTSDSSAVTKGIVLGGAPLVAVPLLGLAAFRSTLSSTKERRDTIEKEIAEFEAKEALRLAQKESDVDGGTLAKAVVSRVKAFFYTRQA
jgi:hypothetical protein